MSGQKRVGARKLLDDAKRDEAFKSELKAAEDAVGTKAGVLKRFPDAGKDLVVAPGGLLLPKEFVSGSRVLHPDQLLDMQIKSRDSVLVSTYEGPHTKLEAFAGRMEEYANSLAAKEDREFKPLAVSYVFGELMANAAKHGAKLSGKPIAVSWDVTPEKAKFTVIDSGTKDFDPYKYVKLDVESYTDEVQEGETLGHAGITILVGRDPEVLVPGAKEPEGLMKRKDLKYLPIRVKGKRVGTRVEATVRSQKISEN